MERPYEQQHDPRRDARPVSEITKLDVLEVILAGHRADEITPFAQTRFAMEIRPIIGIRNSQYEFIVNPIVDVSFGKYGEQRFAPAARAARKFDQDLYAGFEYYRDFGQIGRFGKFLDQEHTLFAVADFKLGEINVNFGVGYGLTRVSDRWVIKTTSDTHFRCPAAMRAAATAP